VIASSGHLKEFLNSYNNETINPLERRSIIWALVNKNLLFSFSFIFFFLFFFLKKHKKGHIGASKTGASLFDKMLVFKEFIRMSTSDPCLSMRG